MIWSRVKMATQWDPLAQLAQCLKHKNIEQEIELNSVEKVYQREIHQEGLRHI